MSSSTSSSSSGSLPPSQRKIFLKVFLVSLFGMAASLGIIRLFTFAMNVSGGSILQRVTEARAALPQVLAEEEDLVMVFGSSMVHAGFSARLFDREMAERGASVKSFNFGFGGLNPYFQDYLARRIRDAFEEEGRELELVVIEFNPFQNTKARWNGAQPVVDSFTGLLASPAEMWEITKRDPARGSQMLNIFYLRDGISAEMITWQFGGFLRNPDPTSGLERDEEMMKRFREVRRLMGEKFDEEYPDFAGEDWYFPWQGAGTIAEERSEETLALFDEYYETLRSPVFMEDDRLDRISCCDILELHFEEELVEAFIRNVQVFQEFSRHVEVMLLPRNTDWIQYSPEARARLQTVVDRIRAETGVTIKDWQEVEGITPAMYSDTTHLARYSGDVAYTSLLVEEYAPLLGAGPRPQLAEGGEEGDQGP